MFLPCVLILPKSPIVSACLAVFIHSRNRSTAAADFKLCAEEAAWSFVPHKASRKNMTAKSASREPDLATESKTALRSFNTYLPV